MTLKYRLLLAVLISLIVFGSQVAFAQTKSIQKDFIIANEAACNCSVSLSPTVVNPTACNLNNGSVILNISGGSGDYSYSWMDSSGEVIATTKDLTNAGVGYYFVAVKDNASPICGLYHSNANLTSPFDVTATVKNNIGCTSPNGGISLTPTGGSGSYKYTWYFADGSQKATKNISGVKAGGYSVLIVDQVTGCRLSRYYTINSSHPLSVNEVSSSCNTSCSSPDGTVTLAVSNGSGQFDYFWYNLQTYSAVAATATLANASGGDYSASVVDRISGCYAYKYVSIPELTSRPVVSIDEVIPNSACAAPFNGRAKLNITGSDGPFEVTWSDGTGVISTLPNPSDLGAGTYGYTVIDTQTKCVSEVSAQSSEALTILDASRNDINLVTSEIKNNTECINANGKIAVGVDCLTPYTLTWSGPETFAASTPSIEGLMPGRYRLTLTTQCNTPPLITPMTVSCQKAAIDLDLASFISDAEDNLDLSSVAVIDTRLKVAQTTVKAGMLQIDYSGTVVKDQDQIRIKACDLLGACSENLLTIEVETSGNLVVYNAVAPNSTGNNQFMRIQNLPQNNKVIIFNRWGDVVFTVDQYNDQSPDKRFDGSTSSGKQLPSGTYLYKIELEGRPPVTGYLSLVQ